MKQCTRKPCCIKKLKQEQFLSRKKIKDNNYDNNLFLLSYALVYKNLNYLQVICKERSTTVYNRLKIA